MKILEIYIEDNEGLNDECKYLQYNLVHFLNEEVSDSLNTRINIFLNRTNYNPIVISGEQDPVCNIYVMYSDDNIESIIEAVFSGLKELIFKIDGNINELNTARIRLGKGEIYRSRAFKSLKSDVDNYKVNVYFEYSRESLDFGFEILNTKTKSLSHVYFFHGHRQPLLFKNLLTTFTCEKGWFRLSDVTNQIHFNLDPKTETVNLDYTPLIHTITELQEYLDALNWESDQGQLGKTIISFANR